MAVSTSKAGTLALSVLLLAAVTQAAVVTVCVPVTTANIAQCGATLTAAAQAAGLTDTFACISKPNAAACSAAVANGEAQLTKFGGDGLFSSHKDYGLRPVVAETLTPAPGLAASPIPTAAYAAVAVVKSDACTKTDLTFADFAGKTACSTGYRRGAGWTLPMGFLIENNIMPVVARETAVEQDAESVANFFGRICAHGVTASGPARSPVDNSGAEWDRLCTACSDPTCAATAAAEPYSDYPGALRCLTQGGGDIAFTKSETLLGDPSGWESATVKQADLRLLCPNRPGCQPLSAWRDCYIALSASHAFVATADFIASPLGATTITFLSGITQAVINSTRTIDPALPNLLFTAGANGVSRVANPADFASHFTPEAVARYEAIRALNVPTVRICTISDAEKATCDQAVPIMNRANTGMVFSCVQADGDTGCLNAIQNNQADMKAFDGGDIYQGYINHNLQAIAAERNPTSETAVGVDYYGVAVVKKSFCDLNGGNPTLADLKGKRACATGYRRSAGWLNPIGALISRGIMPVVRNDAGIEDDAESWASFFSGTCAARTSGNGPVNTADGSGARWDALCTACAGDCNPSIDTEPYYDYTGALRGVMEGACDVGFTKHSIALDFSADGRSPAPWSTVQSTDLALLCPTGGCAPLAQAYRCNIAQAVAHAVMVRVNYPDAERLKVALRTISQDSAFRALIFSGTNNPGNHLFKYITSEIVPVNSDRAVYLGENLKVYEGLDILSSGGNLPGAAPTVQSSSTSSDSSSGLSAGAIAGIAIGAAVGGALLAVAIAFLVVRSRKSKFEQFKEQHSSSPDAAAAAKVPNF